MKWWQRLIEIAVEAILPVLVDKLDQDPANNFSKLGGDN